MSGPAGGGGPPALPARDQPRRVPPRHDQVPKCVSRSESFLLMRSEVIPSRHDQVTAPPELVVRSESFLRDMIRSEKREEGCVCARADGRGPSEERRGMATGPAAGIPGHRPLQIYEGHLYSFLGPYINSCAAGTDVARTHARVRLHALNARTHTHTHARTHTHTHTHTTQRRLFVGGVGAGDPPPRHPPRGVCV